MAGLNPDRVVRVGVTLTAKAVPARNFGALMILGASDVIDTRERLRSYGSLAAIGTDFGTNTPEYQAASLFFSQNPQPSFLYVGRWAQGATAAILHGAALTPSQQLVSNFTAVTAGSMAITVDSTAKTVSGLDLSGVTNLNGVASALQTALTGTTVKWDAVLKRFDIRSATTGTSSTITYASATGSGTDISSLLGLRTGQASAPVNGLAAESLLSAINLLADYSNDWYGLTVATATPPADSDHLAVAAVIEAFSPSRIYGVTITSPSAYDPTVTSDLGSQLQALGYAKTFATFHPTSPYEAASFYGRAFTVDFEASNSTLTMKFKREPGVSPVVLTSSQADALAKKNINVFAQYANGAAFVQEGVMANGDFFDERHGIDWLQNAAQTDVFNLLYTSPTKVPQTDDGTHLIVTVLKGTMTRAVNNGFVAPGIWNAPGFGALRQGDALPDGFYIFAPPVATQSQADREARKSVPIQIAAKLAGAVHSVNVAISVNR